MFAARYNPDPMDPTLHEHQPLVQAETYEGVVNEVTDHPDHYAKMLRPGDELRVYDYTDFSEPSAKPRCVAWITSALGGIRIHPMRGHAAT